MAQLTGCAFLLISEDRHGELRFAYDGNAREINASRKRLSSTTMAEISRPPFRNFPSPPEFK